MENKAEQIKSFYKRVDCMKIEAEVTSIKKTFDDDWDQVHYDFIDGSVLVITGDDQVFGYGSR